MANTQIASAAYTTNQTGPDNTNPKGPFIVAVLDTTVNAGGAGSVTLTIEGKDRASGKYYTLLAGAAVTGVATNVYSVGPGLPVTANVSANAIVPRVWRVKVTANNANPVTYSVGADALPA